MDSDGYSDEDLQRAPPSGDAYEYFLQKKLGQTGGQQNESYDDEISSEESEESKENEIFTRG